MSSIWIFHSDHPLEVTAAIHPTQPRAARRGVVRASLAFLASLLAGGWVIENLSQVEWLARYGWPFVTDLLAPTVALTVVAVGPRRMPPGRLATSDRVSAGAAVVVVIGATAATWLGFGPVAALTPLLVGSTALLVMRDALNERRNRARVASEHR